MKSFLRTLGIACLSTLFVAARIWGDEHAGRETVVLSRLPTDAPSLLPDVATLAPQIIARHGMEEWKATVLTCELHRHLGTYSIIGAKMGIRARELLGAGMDELTVVTKAGSHPPLSCLCDGLQVATGASLGRGAIAVEQGPPQVEAVFAHHGRKLRLTLKAEVAQAIAEELRSLRARFPEGSGYFAAVRSSSLRAWLDLSRATIFDAQWIAGQP